MRVMSMDLGVLQRLFSKRARRIEGKKSRSTGFANLDESGQRDLSTLVEFAYLSSQRRRCVEYGTYCTTVLTLFSTDLLALTYLHTHPVMTDIALTTHLSRH